MQAESQAWNTRLIAHHDLGGHGDGMQVLKVGPYLYVSHLGRSPMALSILNVSDPENPRLVRQLPHEPNTHRHKVQIAGRTLIQNCEKPDDPPAGEDPPPVTGLAVFDLTDPTDPRPVGFHQVGGRGVHRIWYSEPPYAHIAGAACRAAACAGIRSWTCRHRRRPAWPGAGGSRAPRKGMTRRGLTSTPTSSGACTASCRTETGPTCRRRTTAIAILDISDVSEAAPARARQLAPTLRGLRAHRAAAAGPEPGARSVRVARRRSGRGRGQAHLGDRRPRGASAGHHQQLPAAAAAEGLALGGLRRSDPGRFGPHNVHENRPGSFQSERLIFSTWFNAGLRVVDLEQSRPTRGDRLLRPAAAARAGRAAEQRPLRGPGGLDLHDRPIRRRLAHHRIPARISGEGAVADAG